MSQSNEYSGGKASGNKRRWYIFIPLIFFMGLVAVFIVRLGSGDPSKVPSVLIDKPVPEFDAPALAGLSNENGPISGFSTRDLKQGKVSLVNFWASWCGPCRVEHPYLMQLAEDSSIEIYGFNYRDKAENARRFLGQLGNPYDRVGVDPKPKIGFEWGVYGIPETFVVNGQGKIVYKHVGPIDANILETKIKPAIENAKKL